MTTKDFGQEQPPSPRQSQKQGRQNQTQGHTHDHACQNPPVIDRNALVRSRESLLADLISAPDTKFIAVYDRQLAVLHSGIEGTAVEGSAVEGSAVDTFEIQWLSANDFPDYLRNRSDSLWLYLGELDGTAVVALVVPDSVGEISTTNWRSGFSWLGLRELSDHVDSGAASVALPAVALANWHVTALFCGRCGGATRSTSAGWVRTCGSCGVDSFPRTDAAVIMAVVDEHDRLLLGNSTKWEPNRFSTLAGFVEPGETLEAAVRREVFEESGVLVGDVQYFASQPWPFPASLMLGYFARANSTEICVDELEIRAARWFTRDDLVAQVSSGAVGLPGSASIARRLIDTWLAGKNPSV